MARDNPVELFELDILFDGLNVETLENIKMKEQWKLKAERDSDGEKKKSLSSNLSLCRPSVSGNS